VSAGAILVMPFMAGSGSVSWSLGWFGAMISPLILAVVVAGARATVLRPYTPDEDYVFIRQSMGHVVYMHQVLVEEARSTHDRRLNERQDRFDETRERVAQSFRQQLGLLEPSISKFASAAQASGPEWSAPVWRTWIPSNALPRTTCVGEMLAGIRDDRLTIPALVPFPHEKALIIKADSHARARAISAIQSILLRLVATVPPGDLRFILIDPVGRGQNVVPFLPFADQGIGLETGRAWTEPLQIEQRLHDMVTLIEGAAEADAFHTLMPRLDASRANGVAEPLRVLVMLDFPTNVDGATARLLTTILQKGPSQGVHPILMVDTDKTPPYGFNMHDLEQLATTLAWDGRRFVWHDADFRSAWVELDKPPRAPLAKQILRSVRQAMSQPVARSA
jgi:DNA segregation ATPase FtsK/SpoIIIE, S-DNA-T family